MAIFTNASGQCERFARAIACGAVAAACLLAASGCSSYSSDVDKSKQGFSADTEFPTSAVELTIYADEFLATMTDGDGVGIIEQMEERYRSNAGRDVVTFADVKYAAADELLDAAANDPDADAVICTEESMDEALESGTVEGGRAGTSVRDLKSASYTTLVVARKKGSKAKMPDTRLVDGGEQPGGSEKRFDYLDKLDGKLAVCAEDTYQGVSGRSALAYTKSAFYSSESGTGGKFKSSIKGKIVEAEDAADAAKMLKSGKCDLALLYHRDVTADKGLEGIYDIAANYWRPRYKGASMLKSPDGAVARDFLQFFAIQI